MKIFRSGNCRKRKIQTLVLILVIVVVYFLLQFFTLSKLGHFQGGKKVHLEDDGVNDAVPASRRGDSVEWNVKQPMIITAPRGVHPSDAFRYAEDMQGLFKCLESELHIPQSRVNDDFCDCPDSSDEPGTSACPHGRFYCKVQLPHRDPQFVHSSKVNDGICDCCDGSDEWMGQPVPSFMRLNGLSGAVFHTPCNNQCGDFLKLMEDEKRIRRQGLLLQKQYLIAAENLPPHHLRKYGPAGIFYLLSQQCFEHSAHEYRYTVCPFESVKQSSGPVINTVLGRQGHWTQRKPGDYILKMSQGDASLCPDGQPRQTEIHFLCGLEDRVINISEDQKCRYAVRFSTPAAC